MRVTVIGWDGRPITPAAAARLAAASLVLGGRRHLDALAPLLPVDARIIALGDVEVALTALQAHQAAGRGAAVVLASGDPGFFGIVRAMRRHGIDVDVLPAASSVTLAFSRAGLPWDDALVVSAHGRRLDRAVNVCRAHPCVAVLTGPDAGPSAIGAGLAGLGREMFVAESLGMATERTTWCTPEQAAARRDWRDPNVVIVRDPDRSAAADQGHTGWLFPHRPPEGWALPENSFTHRDSMISKSEVRALALARLGPGPGDLIWDVGTGSGSVAVECARLGAAVVAVDHDPGACERTRSNARAHGVSVQVFDGAAGDVFAGLPVPDAVFVGGGGPEVVAAAARCVRRVVVVALAAVDRVRPTWDALAGAGLDVDGTQLAASRLRPLPDGALRLAATNPVLLLWGQRRRDDPSRRQRPE